MWRVTRRSKNEERLLYNGKYKNEETAAHASDTLARNLIANGEKGHKLNFPDDHTEVFTEVTQYATTNLILFRSSVPTFFVYKVIGKKKTEILDQRVVDRNFGRIDHLEQNSLAR